MLTLEKNIQICAWVFTFSVNLEKWSFHVADLPRTRTKCTEIKQAREGPAKLLFLSIKYANFVAQSLQSRRWFLNSLIRSLSKHDVDNSENVIWKCNFGFLQSFRNYSSHYAFKMFSKKKRFSGKNTNVNILLSYVHVAHNCKTRHFTSWKEREGLQNVKRWKMHVQSVQKYCFSLSNMRICDVLVAVVIVVA